MQPIFDAGLKGLISLVRTTGKEMCSKAGESEPFYFLLSTIMSTTICNADAEVIVKSVSNPQTLDEWMMGIAVLVYVTVQVGSETALQRDSFSKEPYVLP